MASGTSTPARTSTHTTPTQKSSRFHRRRQCSVRAPTLIPGVIPEEGLHQPNHQRRRRSVARAQALVPMVVPSLDKIIDDIKGEDRVRYEHKHSYPRSYPKSTERLQLTRSEDGAWYERKHSYQGSYEVNIQCIQALEQKMASGPSASDHASACTTSILVINTPKGGNPRSNFQSLLSFSSKH